MSSSSLMRRVFSSSKPPDGGYPPPFRLLVGGTQPHGSWYLSAIVRLQGFSSCSPVGEDLVVCWIRLSTWRLGAHVGRVAFKRRATPFGRQPHLLPPSCVVSFHLPSPRMGGIRRLSASSLEERDSVGVGTFQPSFGFKDFHHTARLLPSAGGHPRR